MHTLKIIFGKEQVLKNMRGEALNEEEKVLFVKAFHFSTMAERESFKNGMEAAAGWMDWVEWGALEQ